jgi:hypothetical protein
MSKKRKKINMIDTLIELRAALFAQLRSGERAKNRRATLLAYKHIDKAARILGASRLDIPRRAKVNPVPVYQAQEQELAPETQPTVVLADNSAPLTGPEKPVKAKRR